MKAFLMYKDRDFDPQQSIPANSQSLFQDLELKVLFNSMALGDQFIYDVVKKAILSSLNDEETISYRQGILKDCLNNSAIVRDLYQIPIESQKNKQKYWLHIYGYHPGGILSSAIEMLQMFVVLLEKIKMIAVTHASKFESEGFTRFFRMIQNELDDKFFADVQDHLQELRFRNGVLLSAQIGKGNESKNYVLRRPHRNTQNWVKQVFTKKSPVYSYRLDPRDEYGARALTELKDKGINLVANALAQSAEHIDSFLEMLRIELAFYIGCMNLHDQLEKIGESITFPLPISTNERRLSFSGLYDVCLALTMKQKIVGNTVNADHKDLVVITGANQGGKSTFLRSVGLAQIMLQAGMFVPADSFSANLCTGIFTHYKRKEDASMKSGKLDEELSRMSEIIDQISPNALILFNESFAATNEREGSEIARQIVSALLEKKIKVCFVTHMYDFAHSFYNKKFPNAIFLRAERQSGGGRTYKLFEGEPMQTSHGQDLYYKIFETSDQIRS